MKHIPKQMRKQIPTKLPTKPPTKTQRGGTLLGFLAGLITGLVVAVVVALYISKAPVPFGNKTVRQEPLPNPISNKALQDPNLSLYPKQSAPGTEVPLFKPDTESSKAAPAVDAGESKKPEATDTTLLLQVGAYKAQEDAENMKARLALMGVEGKISMVEVEGKPLYRVRVTYHQPEELQAGRKRLSDNGIESAIAKSK